MYQIIILFFVCKSVTLSLFFNSMNLNQCWYYVDVMIWTLISYLRKISGFVFTIQQKKSREMLESHSLGIEHYKTQNIFNCTIFHILPQKIKQQLFLTLNFDKKWCISNVSAACDCGYYFTVPFSNNMKNWDSLASKRIFCHIFNFTEFWKQVYIASLCR